MWTVLLALYYLMAMAYGGYYKIRPPHPPHPPPPSLYYGPHPPHKPTHHSPRIYPPYPPFRSPHHRLYHQRYPKPPPPPPPPPSFPPWKNNYAPSFRAPIIQESFNSPHNLYAPTTFLKDEDKGPIHTIPAPNLGPVDRPSLPNLFQPEGYKNDYKNDGIKKPVHSKLEDLTAVLTHGITKVNVPHSTGYQVTEDPAAASPYNTASSSFFAPDPDPQVPFVKIPPTNDPFSRPTNGQVPLDLYLQQQAEKNGQYGHYQHSADNSNTLTPQELFNLLNYQQPSTLQQPGQYLLPQQTGQLFTNGHQENVQQQLAQQDFVNQHLAQQHLAQKELSSQQISHQHLTYQPEPTNQHQFSQPQYQSFNYEEQGQQSAYGDLRLDLNNKGFGVADNEFHKDPFDDNDVAGSEREESYENIVTNEVQQRQKEDYFRKEKENGVENVKEQFPKKQISSDPNVYHPNMIANNVQNEKILPHNQNQETPSVQRGDPANENKNSEEIASIKPDNNVQLQKSIQIYENTYENNEGMVKESIKNTNDFKNDFTDEKKIEEELAMGHGDKNFKNENVHFVDAVPYGSRIRPKRF